MLTTSKNAVPWEKQRAVIMGKSADQDLHEMYPHFPPNSFYPKLPNQNHRIVTDIPVVSLEDKEKRKNTTVFL